MKAEVSMNTNVKKLAGTALLAALIIVFQTVASGIKIGTFTPTLSLIPIVIGALLYGPMAGCFLGFVFGLIVVIGVLSGAEAMSTMMLNLNPVMTIFLCFFKGMMAGFIPGIVYQQLKDKNELVATAVSAVLAPVMNTGIFCAGILTIFKSITESVGQSLGFASAGSFVLYGVVGMNFIFELAFNVVLIPAIIRIINIIRK